MRLYEEKLLRVGNFSQRSWLPQRGAEGVLCVLVATASNASLNISSVACPEYVCANKCLTEGGHPGHDDGRNLLTLAILRPEHEEISQRRDVRVHVRQTFACHPSCRTWTERTYEFKNVRTT